MAWVKRSFCSVIIGIFCIIFNKLVPVVCQYSWVLLEITQRKLTHYFITSFVLVMRLGISEFESFVGFGYSNTCGAVNKRLSIEAYKREGILTNIGSSAT